MTALKLSPTGVQQPSLSNVIDEWFGSDFSMYKKTNHLVNIIEYDDHFMVQLTAPGYSKSNFTLSVDHNHLTVTAEQPSNTECDPLEYFRLKEFSISNFTKSFKLADTIDTESISARYNNGILSIQLAKKEEAKKKPPKLIAIS